MLGGDSSDDDDVQIERGGSKPTGSGSNSGATTIVVAVAAKPKPKGLVHVTIGGVTRSAEPNTKTSEPHNEQKAHLVCLSHTLSL